MVTRAKGFAAPWARANRLDNPAIIRDHPTLAMRSPLILIFLLCSGSLLHAQKQERKLVDRILKPDMTLGYSMQNLAYNGAGSGGLELKKDASVKDFYFVQKFTAKGFETKDYEAKSFWQGDFQFTTKAADVKTDSAAQKIYATKALPVKEAREAGKLYQDGGRAYATREAPERGKTSQNHLDEIYKGKEQMNIDQVRDLLNKPKL
jgi:hypothetical protein